MIRRRRVAAFTLIELLVAASILAIGLVAILRSFLGAASAVGLLESRFEVRGILEQKSSELLLRAGQSGGSLPEIGETPLDLRGRKAVLRVDTSPFIMETSGGSLEKVALLVTWQEGGVPKDDAIEFFISEKK